MICPGGEQIKIPGLPWPNCMPPLTAITLTAIPISSHVGGGALLDMVGLAAATAHRGVRHVRIPTTTLSQCDSGVGVKNGINAFGKKNFIGTFAPPFAVINDFQMLATLVAARSARRICGSGQGGMHPQPGVFETMEADAVTQLAQFEPAPCAN